MEVELIYRLINDINLGIKYLHENTRFLLNSYPKNLNKCHIYDIVDIIEKTKYVCTINYFHGHNFIADVIFDLNCVLTHDGDTITIKLPNINVEQLAVMMITHSIASETRTLLLMLLVSQNKMNPTAIIRQYDRDPSNEDLCNSLSDEYLLEYLRYIYDMSDKSRIIWDDSVCKKFLNLD